MIEWQLSKADETIEDPAERLMRLVDQQEPRIAQIFRQAVSQLKDEIDIDELAALLEQGRVNEAMDRLIFIAESLASATNVAFVTAGQSTAKFLSDAGIGRVVFNQIDINAVATMQANRIEKVREFTNEQRKATSMAIVSGVEAGTNPRVAARNFRDSIGLTSQQWTHVANYRAALERVSFDSSARQNAIARELATKTDKKSIEAAFRNNKPLTADRIDKMVETYTNRYIAHRAEVIGRTEAMRAVNGGNEETYRQAIAAGKIDASKLDREWRTRVDGRERRTHLFLNGVKTKWNEAWVTENGVIKYPGDPDAPAVETIQCRCAILTRIRQR